MDPVAKTAYYCCGVRAADARSARPILGDGYAQRFMDKDGEAVFARFAGLSRPNASNVTRARIIDDWLRRELETAPGLHIVLLGAGFDSRAFRLPGGNWMEIDHPAVIAVKDRLLPVSEARMPLQRIAIDFANERLQDKLQPFRGTENAIVVLEGVSMYLTQAQLAETLATLRASFPGHRLMCDLMTADFSRRYGGPIRAAIAELGGQFAPLVDRPWESIKNGGYRLIERQSIVGRSREIGAIGIPNFLLATLLKPLRDGYCVFRFVAEP
jgi:methyltransferase (TIGR00027 family)